MSSILPKTYENIPSRWTKWSPPICRGNVYHLLVEPETTGFQKLAFFQVDNFISLTWKQKLTPWIILYLSEDFNNMQIMRHTFVLRLQLIMHRLWAVWYVLQWNTIFWVLKKKKYFCHSRVQPPAAYLPTVDNLPYWCEVIKMSNRCGNRRNRAVTF